MNKYVTGKKRKPLKMGLCNSFSNQRASQIKIKIKWIDWIHFRTRSPGTAAMECGRQKNEQTNRHEIDTWVECIDAAVDDQSSSSAPLWRRFFLGPPASSPVLRFLNSDSPGSRFTDRPVIDGHRSIINYDREISTWKYDSTSRARWSFHVQIKWLI